MFTQSELVALLSDLIRIDSSNPWLVKGSPGEAQLGEYIKKWLEPVGVEVWLEDVEAGRKNLIARYAGSGTGRSLCLYAHLDTVGYALWPERALAPRVEGDRLYGLGAADDKGHCAVAMLMLKSLVEGKVRPRGDVWLVFPIDEEGPSSGSMHFVKHYHPDAALVLEPFGLGRISVTHQGFGWLDLHVKGRAAHGSAPEVGIDAIAYMAEVINRLRRLDQEKFASTAHPLNGKTVFHTSTIQGGTDYATYPEGCTLGIEIGTQPGETIDVRVVEIEAIFAEIRALYPDFNGDVLVKLARDPFEARGHEALWEVLSTHIEKELGGPPIPAGENAWGDAALFQQAGIPTLMLGAYGENLHAPDEWVAIPDLMKLGKILVATAQEFCS
jgi:acetylornithine deacetylase/succinyl-diaminopimelate desuccinylase-like protein